MSDASITPWKLLTATAALLAFLVGLYTLVGRERKSPHQINKVFPILFFCLLGAIADLISTVLYDTGAEVALKAGLGFLILAMSMTAWRLYRFYFRFALFVDSGNPKYFHFMRTLKAWGRDIRNKQIYEHHAISVPDDLKKEILEILKEETNSQFFNLTADPKSVALHSDGQRQATTVLARIAIAFLKKQYPVQYMTASRHPIEFVEKLKAILPGTLDWNAICKNIVVVDAYTKHFGFTDSIYFTATRKLTNLYVTPVTSSISYAGLHTASSRAFNKIKSMSPEADTRNPALVIYEDSYALSDLESPEQYRVFIRHVLPSERLWEGMFTIFVETALPDSDWDLLRSYVDVYAELNSLPEVRHE
jgi:hypothetical protein